MRLLPVALDWSNLNTGSITKLKDTRVQSRALSAYHYARLKIASHVQRKSMGEVAETAIITYLNKNFDTEHFNALQALANSQGLSVEEYAQKIIDDEVES